MVIVASVSCIYGLGSPEAYYGMLLFVRQGMTLDRRDLLARLVEARYERNDYALERGSFRARGDVIEIVPAYEESGIRIELFGDEVERISAFDPLTGKTSERLAQVAIYPSSAAAYDDPFFSTPPTAIEDAGRSLAKQTISTYQDIVPFVVHKADVNEILNKAIQSALFNKVPAKEALDKAVADANKIIK